jgi:hypothetical protein
MGRDALTETCNLCGKAITDEEWVTNWASCASCFDKNYEEYLLAKEQEE